MADTKEKPQSLSCPAIPSDPLCALIKAVEVLADKINGDIKADDALKYTHAACNAANTICSIESSKR